MALTNAEQYLLELMNRARLDPVGEARRFGINLNQDLPDGTLGTQVRQVLAPNTRLESAAISHSKWMINSDQFSHTESNGSAPSDRATHAGYIWSNVGENIAFRGTTGNIDLQATIKEQYRDLFLSAPHRENTLGDAYREVGLAQERGDFTYSGNTFDSSLLTELFGRSGSKVFLTGVAYTDKDHDDFYSIGEARGDVIFRAQGQSTQTAASGGYGLGLRADDEVAVSGKVGSKAFSATVALDNGNVKLDVVNGTKFLTSGDITLGTGINEVGLLGKAALSATGNAAGNLITGNAAANLLSGRDGADRLYGGSGNDRLLGGLGGDKLYGGAGGDKLVGDRGNDILSGGSGRDRLEGREHNDTLTGGSDSDSFVFSQDFGHDKITDFSRSADDTLKFDASLWNDAHLSASQVVAKYAHIEGGHVVFDFGNTETVDLLGVTSLSGLAGQITIL